MISKFNPHTTCLINMTTIKRKKLSHNDLPKKKPYPDQQKGIEDNGDIYEGHQTSKKGTVARELSSGKMTSVYPCLMCFFVLFIPNNLFRLCKRGYI